MSTSARVCQVSGGIALAATVVNQLLAPAVEPALQRSSALAALLSVGLLLIGVLWSRLAPVPPERAELEGNEGLLLRNDLPDRLSRELTWGSRQLLTATPAAVVLLWWRGAVVLQRGLLARQGATPGFSPGAICQQALERQRAIHLVDLRHYPGRDEFAGLLDGLPSVLIQPVGSDGLLLLGGWSPRCFSSADQTWTEGWAERLRDEWLNSQAPWAMATGEAGNSTSPANPENGR